MSVLSVRSTPTLGEGEGGEGTTRWSNVELCTEASISNVELWLLISIPRFNPGDVERVWLWDIERFKVGSDDESMSETRATGEGKGSGGGGGTGGWGVQEELHRFLLCSCLCSSSWWVRACLTLLDPDYESCWGKFDQRRTSRTQSMEVCKQRFTYSPYFFKASSLSLPHHHLFLLLFLPSSFSSSLSSSSLSSSVSSLSSFVFCLLLSFVFFLLCFF